MRQRASWYFDGYKRIEEDGPDGKKGGRLVYVGEWYGFPGGRAEMNGIKKKTLFLSVVCFLACFYAQFHPSAGGMVHWLAIPSLLSLVPMMYMVIGFVNFLPAKEKWEIRVYYAGYRRLYRSSVTALVFLGVWLLMEIGFIVLNPGEISGELKYLAAVAVGTGALAVQVYLMHFHPVVVTEPGKTE